MSQSMIRGAIGLAGVLCSLLLPPAAPAATYRWVDESGVTVYSQSRPPDVEAQRLGPGTQSAQHASSTATTTPSAAPAAPTAEALVKQYEEQRKQREEEAKAAQDKSKADAAKKRNCEAARQNLETLQNLGPRRLRHSDGTFERLSEEQTAERIDRAKAQIKTYCD